MQRVKLVIVVDLSISHAEAIQKVARAANEFESSTVRSINIEAWTVKDSKPPKFVVEDALSSVNRDLAVESKRLTLVAAWEDYLATLGPEDKCPNCFHLVKFHDATEMDAGCMVRGVRGGAGSKRFCPCVLSFNTVRAVEIPDLNESEKPSPAPSVSAGKNSQFSEAELKEIDEAAELGPAQIPYSQVASGAKALSSNVEDDPASYF